MIQHFTIIGRLPNINDLIHGHWKRSYRLKKEAMESVGWQILLADIKPVTIKAIVEERE